MSFNPDPSKQAHEIIISCKSKRTTHPPLVFNNNNISKALVLFPNTPGCQIKLTFEEDLNNVLAKVNKAVGLLCKFRNLLPKTTLITIYKVFIWPHLDYGDVLYDQAFNKSFKEKLESIQYNACLALTGAIRGTSKKHLGLEFLQDRRWCRKLCLFL